jgi:thioredoxin-related protein
LEKQTLSDPSVVTELGSWIALSLDAESPAGAPVARRYAVRGYPTLLVLDGEGREVGRIAGFLEPGPFLDRLHAIARR